MIRLSRPRPHLPNVRCAVGRERRRKCTEDTDAAGAFSVVPRAFSTSIASVSRMRIASDTSPSGTSKAMTTVPVAAIPCSSPRLRRMSPSANRPPDGAAPGSISPSESWCIRESAPAGRCREGARAHLGAGLVAVECGDSLGRHDVLRISVRQLAAKPVASSLVPLNHHDPRNASRPTRRRARASAGR